MYQIAAHVILYTLTISIHSLSQTLHVSTVLASIALSLVNNTRLLISARIRQVLTHCTFEEAFASLTTTSTSYTTRVNITHYH